MQQVNFHPQVLLAITEIADGNMDPRFSNKKKVKENRKKVFSSLNLDPADIIETQQIHDTILLTLYEENTKMWRGENIAGIDGLLTDIPEPILMIRVADCAPVAFFDPEHHALALIHIGRQGADLNLPQLVVDKMITDFDTDPQKLLAWIGPAAQKDSYRFQSQPQFKNPDQWEKFIEKKTKYIYIDVPGFIRSSLLKQGLYAKNIIYDQTDTITAENFYSHYRSQRQQQKEGRMAVIAKLIA